MVGCPAAGEEGEKKKAPRHLFLSPAGKLELLGVSLGLSMGCLSKQQKTCIMISTLKKEIQSFRFCLDPVLVFSLERHPARTSLRLPWPSADANLAVMGNGHVAKIGAFFLG